MTEQPAAVPGPARSRPSLKTFIAQFSLSALAVQAIWAFNVSAMKYTITQLDPYLVGAMRMSLAGVVLLALLYRAEGDIRLARRHWPLIIVMALCMGLNTMCWQKGLSRTSASNASLIVNIAPVFAMLMAVGLRQERLNLRRVVGMCLALGGVVLIIDPTRVDLQHGALWGELLIVGAAIFWAAYNVVAVRLVVRYSALRVTSWAMLLCSVVLWIGSPLGVDSWAVAQARPLAWMGVLYAAILGAVVAQTLWTRTIQRLGASLTMIYSYINPLLVVIFAALFLGERLTAWQGVGAVLALSGVALTNARPAQPPRATSA